jgi:chemotaxis protein MotB
MKTLRIISAVVLSGIFLSSCVSMGKYNTQVSKTQQLTEENEDLQARVAKMKGEMGDLKASSSEALNDKEVALKEKEWELAEREAKMRELNMMVNEQRQAVQALKQEVCSALKCFSPDELTVDVRNGKLYVSLSDKLLFPSGSDKVNERGEEAVQMLSAVLANSDLEIMVEGHTDAVPINTGRNKDNWDLSAHRATSVSRIMIDNGIAPERIIASGRGEHHPMAPNETADGRQSNRRTEVVLAPKLDKLWELTEEEPIEQTQR